MAQIADIAEFEAKIRVVAAAAGAAAVAGPKGNGGGMHQESVAGDL